MNIIRDIESMPNFRRKPAEFLQHIRETKRPLILTVNGKAAAVLQDAQEYQRLLDMAAQADAGEGVRQGLEDLEKGTACPAREVFDALRSKAPANGVSRPGAQTITPAWRPVFQALAEAGAEGLTKAGIAEVCEDAGVKCWLARFVEGGFMEPISRGVYTIT